MAIRPVIQNNSNASKLMQYCKRHENDICKILTKEEERALIDELKDKDPDKLRELLVMHNVALVFNMAAKFMGSAKSFDDMVQNGFIGLTEAANKFDFKRSNKFATYAYTYIYKYIWRTSYRDANDPDPTTNAISLDGSISDFSSKQSDDDEGAIGNYLENHIDPTFQDEAVAPFETQLERNAMSNIYESMRKYILTSDFTDVDRIVFDGSFINNLTQRKISSDNNIPLRDVRMSYEKILGKMKEKLRESGIGSLDAVL